MLEKQYLTKDKFEELQKELDFLKRTRRSEVARDLEYAKSLGDLSENAEYHEARGAQASLEDRIMKIEGILKTAEIVETQHTEAIQVGSVVIVQKEGEKDTKKYIIVGSEEADMASGKISNKSPLGVALIGKKKGQNFTFSTPKGKVNYAIVNIE